MSKGGETRFNEEKVAERGERSLSRRVGRGTTITPLLHILLHQKEINKLHIQDDKFNVQLTYYTTTHVIVQSPSSTAPAMRLGWSPPMTPSH